MIIICPVCERHVVLLIASNWNPCYCRGIWNIKVNPPAAASPPPSHHPSAAGVAVKTPANADYFVRKQLSGRMAGGPLEQVLTTTDAIALSAAAASAASAASGVPLILSSGYKLIPSLNKPTDMAAVGEYAAKVHAARKYLTDLKASLKDTEAAENRDLLQEIIPEVSGAPSAELSL